MFRQPIVQRDKSKYSIGLIISPGKMFEHLCFAEWVGGNLAKFIKMRVLKDAE